jgi:hypothetical protein
MSRSVGTASTTAASSGERFARVVTELVMAILLAGSSS